MRISKKIQQIREQNGISQEQLAKDLAVTRQAVSKWENGKSLPDIENLMYISDLYGVSLDELVKGDPVVGKKVVADSSAKEWHKLNISIFALTLIYIAWFGVRHDIWQIGLAITAAGMILTDAWLLVRVKAIRSRG